MLDTFQTVEILISDSLANDLFCSDETLVNDQFEKLLVEFK
jgi:hypothetical protein